MGRKHTCLNNPIDERQTLKTPKAMVHGSIAHDILIAIPMVIPMAPMVSTSQVTGSNFSDSNAFASNRAWSALVVAIGRKEEVQTRTWAKSTREFGSCSSSFNRKWMPQAKNCCVQFVSASIPYKLRKTCAAWTVLWCPPMTAIKGVTPWLAVLSTSVQGSGQPSSWSVNIRWSHQETPWFSLDTT